MGETGAMINMSLIPAAKFDGTLQYDDVEGFVHEQAFELRNRYPDTAGTICIGIDDKQIDMLLENDDIDYVIPYHRSGMDAATRRKMRIPTWHDYESQQNEKALGKDAGKAPKFSEWFDYKTAAREAREANNTAEGKAAIAAGDVMYGAKVAMQNAAQRYMNLCAERNLAPKFQKFTDNSGYWKLLIDRKMINNVTGEIIEQKALQPVFDEDTLIEICQDEVSKFNQTNADFQYAVDAVLDAYESGTLSKAAKSEKVQQAVRDHENWMAVQAAIGSQEQAVEGKRFSSRDVDGDFSNDFNTRGIQWVYDEYLLSREQQRQFHDAHREISHRRYNSFQKTSDGEYIIPVDGAIIFSNGQYKNPSISAIIRLNVSDPAETVAMIGEALNNGKRSGHFDKHQAWAIIDAVFKDGSAEFFHRRIRGKDTDVEYRRSGDNSREADYAGEAWRSEESVDDSTRYQERDFSELSDRELLANAVESVAQNDTERDYIKRYKKHIAELNEKQLAMQEAEEQIRELKAEDAKGNRDEIIKLQNKVDIYAKQISRADAKLLDYEATKPIKDMLTREKAEYKRKRDARAKEQMARYRENQHQRTLDRIREVREAEANKRKAMRERADERQRKAVEHAREVGQRKVDRMKESQGKEKYRAQILQDAKKLYGWVVSPTNKGHVPEMLKRPLGEFLESIDFSSARSLKGGEATRNDRRMIKALDDLRRALSNVHDQESLDKGAVHVAGYVDLPSDYLRELDALVGKIEATLDMADKVTDTPFMLMTSEQLHEMSKMFRILNTSISKMNTVHENAMYESNRTMSGHTIDDMTSMTAKLKTNKHLAKLNSLFNWKNATPYYAFQRLGRGGKAIFDGFQNGWDKMAQNSAKLIKYAEDAFKPQQAKAWSKDVKSIKLDSGEKFQMTASQAMSLYCLSKRDQAIGHLMGGGIRISDIDMGKGNTLSQVNNYILSEKDISRIIGTLTAEQKAVADKLQKFLNTVCSDWGNEISMKRFGYKMFTEEFYFPIETDANNRSRIDDKQEGKTSMFRLLNMSAMKQLTPNANNAIIIRDIFDVFSNHATDIAKYNAMALPILDFIKWYNYVEKSAVLDANGKPTGQITTRSVQKALEHAYGQDAKQYMLQFIRDINGEHDGGRNDDVINKLTNRAKTAAVGANLRVYLLQLTSLPRAAYAINPVYLARSAAKIKNYAPGKLIKGGDAQNDIGILKWKNLGFYSTDINNSVRDMVRRDQNVLDKVREWQMAPAGWMDNITGNIIYEAVKLEMADKHPNLKPGTEAYKGMLNKRVREIVYKTQVVDSTMTRSELMRSKGIISAATAFMSEPTLTVNMLNESLQEAIMKKRGAKLDPSDLSPGKKAGRAVAVFLVSATVTSIVGALADAFRDDDDYEEFEKKYLDALKKNAIDNVNIFGMIPIIKEVSDVAGKIIKGQDYKPNTLAVQVLTSASNTASAIKDWNEGKGTLANAIFNGLKTGSYGSGVGVYNAVRDIASIYNTFFADVLNTPKIQTYADKKTTAAEAYYDALQEGDAEKAEWILHRAKINGYDVSDFSNKITERTKEDFFAGKIDAATAEEYLVKHAGKKPETADKSVSGWAYEQETGSKFDDMRDDYIAGTVSKAKAKEYLSKYGGKDAASADEQIDRWDYYDATGASEGYTKYWRMYYALENNGDFYSEARRWIDSGMKKGDIARSIAGRYKSRYLAIKGTAEGEAMLEMLLDLYEAIGYDRDYERNYINNKWTDD